MSSVAIILALIVIANSIFLVKFLLDLYRHRQALKNDKRNRFTLAVSSFMLFFFSSFGICDFAVSSIVYRAKNLVSDKQLPGTLNTQCVLPVAVMALAFISSITVDKLTLISCITSQILGAYIGPRFVIQLPISAIRKIIGIALLIAALFIVAGQLHWLPTGGVAIELRGIKLCIACLSLFIFGALNNVGIGSYPLTMATLYALGMNPLAAFPIMMGACAFSTSISSLQFIKYGEYSRKITLFTATFGVLGALVAVHLVKNLNVSLLQWIISAVLIYTSTSMLKAEFKWPLYYSKPYPTREKLCNDSQIK